MESRKKLGIASFILLVFLIVFFGETKHGFVLGDYILSKIGISVWSDGNTGVHYTGIVTSVLTLISLFCILRFRKDVHEKFGKFVLIFFIVSYFVYPPIYNSVYGAVKSNMSGLSSIEYIREKSRIEFSSNSNDIKFNGKITLKNYSEKEKEFYIKIPLDNDRDLFGDVKEATVCNDSHEIIKFTIEPESEIGFDVKAYVKPNHSVNSSSGNIVPDVVIFNETEEKRFQANVY